MSAGLVTIVIPTHNRPFQLMTLLESIQEYYTPEIDQVIVVDDSENPIDLTNKFPSLKIRHISLHDRVFISRAKNVGWKDALTEFVFFIDDDNVLASDTVTRALNAITRMKEVAAVMPAVLYKSRPDLVWVYATPFTSQAPKFNLLGRNLPRNPDLEGRYYSTDALPNSCIIRKAALEEVGGFNERLVVNSSMDLAVRLKRRGWKVYAFTGCFIYHDVEPPGKIGWWATHGAADPKRVRYEIRDWFIIMKIVRGKETFLTLRSVFQSLRFVVPNSLAYALRGRERRELLTGLAKGYVEGIVESFRT
ncbi:MAG: glycosyltransferase family 2 protein [Nitrososphaerales archaeon]